MQITNVEINSEELILYFPNRELPDHGFIAIQYRHKLRNMSVQETKDFFTQEQLPVVFQASEEDCSALLDILCNCSALLDTSDNCVHYTLGQARIIIHWLEVHRENLREDEYYVEWCKGESVEACGNEYDWPSIYESILMGAN
jgi:hypothetical protein